MSKKGNNWGENETKVFLELCIDAHIINLMDGKKYKHIEIFRCLEAKMNEKGFLRTAEQMQLKLKHLKQAFMKCKRENSVSGAAKTTCPFYDELEIMYGHRPNVSGMEGGIDTATIEASTSELTQPIDFVQLESLLDDPLLEFTDTDQTSDQTNKENIMENVDDDSNVDETPKRKRPRKCDNYPDKQINIGRKSYDAALNKYCTKMMEGQKEMISVQIEAQNKLFHEEMEAQRQWELEVIEKEHAFQREQTALLMNTLQNLQTPGSTFSSACSPFSMNLTQQQTVPLTTIIQKPHLIQPSSSSSLTSTPKLMNIIGKKIQLTKLSRAEPYVKDPKPNP